MINGMDIGQLQDHLKEQDSLKIDYIQDGNQMDFQTYVQEEWNEGLQKHTITNHGEMRLYGDDYEETVRTTPHANMQIGNRFGIPNSYFNRMLDTEPDLLKANVNWWMRKAMPEKKHMVRTLGGRARAFVSNRFNNQLDNYDVVQTLLPPLEKLDVTFKDSYVTDNRMYLRGMIPGMEREITTRRKVGEVVRMGFCFSNSEIGLGQLVLEPEIITLACLNGMTINQLAHKRKHIGMSYSLNNEIIYKDSTKALANQAWLSSVKDEIEHIFKEDSFDKIVEQMQNSADSKEIKDLEKTRDNVVKDFAMSEAEGKKILEELFNSGDRSQWGMASAITASAHNAPHADRKMDLNKIGWDVVNMEPRKWEELAIAA